MRGKLLILLTMISLGLFMSGCNDDSSTSSTVTNPNPEVFSPTGSISGVVTDYCTKAPVSGAIVTVAYAGGVYSVTTDSNGAYSFSNVPANSAGSYVVTCDLRNVTSYGYATYSSVNVGYNHLADGTNGDLGTTTEGGSGANTPVNNLAAICDFKVGPPTSSIAGTIYDVSTGRAVTGVTVALYRAESANDVLVASVESSDGTYSFQNIPPSAANGYKIMATKTGYEYAKLQPPKITAVADGSGDGYQVKVAVPIDCGQAVKDVNVNIIANPDKDKTVPYITSVAAGGELDIIDGDSFPNILPSAVANIVFNFSETMNDSRTTRNAVTLSAICSTVTLSKDTSTKTMAGVTLYSSYQVSMTSAGVMTIAMTLRTLSDYAVMTPTSTTGPVLANTTTAWDGATITYGTATYTVTLTEDSPHLTDASNIPWSLGAPGEVEGGYLHAPAAAYQNKYILGGSGSNNISFTVH